METITIDSEMMKKYGIDFLTGEACALSMRILCEVEPKMMQTYLDYTGFKTSLEHIAKSQYNSRDKYSVFLTHEVIEDLIIMRLMDEHEMVVEILPRETEPQGYRAQKYLLVGGADEVRTWIKERFTDGYNSFHQVGRTYAIYNAQPRRGFSNIHGMTGLSQ